MRYTILAFMLMVAGCASNPQGVVPLDDDSYLLSRHGTVGFGGEIGMMTGVFQEAYQYCSEKQKKVQVVSSSQGATPYMMGGVPKIDIRFRCVVSVLPPPTIGEEELRQLPTVPEDNSAPENSPSK